MSATATKVILFVAACILLIALVMLGKAMEGWRSEIKANDALRATGRVHVSGWVLPEDYQAVNAALQRGRPEKPERP
jgi:hypothetical protein